MKLQKSGSKSFKIIYISRIAAFLSGAAILLTACENNLEQIKAFSAPEELPVVEAQNFETMYTDSGEVRFYIKAPKLLQFETEGRSYFEFPEGIELIKYDENQNVISSITADYAKNFEREEKWEAKNNVIATNAQGDTLKTEHLIWEEKSEIIYTEEFVRIIRQDQIITGIGFHSDQAMQNWRIKNPKGTIYIEMNNTNPTAADTVMQDTPIEIPPADNLQLLPINK
jgi:LPS export ABC transporter protein LptC